MIGKKQIRNMILGCAIKGVRTTRFNDGVRAEMIHSSNTEATFRVYQPGKEEPDIIKINAQLIEVIVGAQAYARPTSRRTD